MGDLVGEERQPHREPAGRAHARAPAGGAGSRGQKNKKNACSKPVWVSLRLQKAGEEFATFPLAAEAHVPASRIVQSGTEGWIRSGAFTGSCLDAGRRCRRALSFPVPILSLVLEAPGRLLELSEGSPPPARGPAD